MEKIKIINRTDKDPLCEWGDILYGGKYIQSIRKKNKSIPWGKGDIIFLYSTHNCYNPWERLQEFNIDSEDVEKSFKYKCPWSDNQYYWFMPLAIESPNGQQYIDKLPEWIQDVQKDKEWMMSRHKEYILSNVAETWMGHGYTDMTYPSDGGLGREVALLKLDNGDIIAGFVWIWYNK